MSAKKAPPKTFGATARRLVENGYRPTPVKGKSAFLPGWPEREFQTGDVQLYANDSTGIVCGEVVGVDIDIRRVDLSEQVEALAVKMLGEAPRRIGAAPKVLRMYRTEQPFSKIGGRVWKLPGDEPGHHHKIEILATGQQFVAFGVHKDTKRPYKWNGCGDPLSVPATELHSVTAAQAEAFVDAADAILRKAASGRTSKVDFGATSAILESTRNSTLASVAGRLRKAGLSADAIDAALQKHNAEHCKPPLQSKEVSQIARSIGKYPIDVTPPTLVGPEHARPTLDELTGVPYEAPMIIEGYLSQDAGGFVAPGGTGKSTLILYESVHIILGKPLYGRAIVRPGPTLFVTAEDSRAVVLARLNWICRCLRLSEQEMQQVQRGFYVEDISASSTRLAKVDRNGGVEATEFVAELIGQYAEVRLSSVTLDPTSLIGPGETSGNDGMAELMRIARRVVNGLGAAVRLIHHVSQHVARGGIADQYAGRGGTAFADNSRSNHQLKIMNSRSFEHGGVEYVVPTEASDAALANDEVLVIFIHKMSYAKRDTTPICVLRNGFAFRDLDLERIENTPEARAVRDADAVETVVEFIRDKKDMRISKTALSTNYLKDLRLSRDAVRKAVDEALSLGRLENAELPQSERHGMRKDYLKVPKVKP